MAVADFMGKLRPDEEMALLLCMWWLSLETNNAEYSVVTLPAVMEQVAEGTFQMVVVGVRFSQFNCSCW